MADQSLSPNKQALLKIRELKQQLANAQHQTGEPIAIVSMACRFPKTSDTPEKFWQSLINQEDLVGEIPDDRWDLDAFHDDDPNVPGKMYARKGVFLDHIDMMDPEFFGISPREATWVDPQQRLLMEVGWEAIERANWIPAEIGDSTGVFVGWMHNDYQNEASDSFLNLNPYIATGAAGSFLCGRLAYYLGLQGPAVAVDTACSSSLVALHLAIQSLQRRDCDQALVGGVNAICSPTTNILTCKLKALSPQGHSRAFDADADGYLRGEGCGVVTLRRLSDAKNSGDPILGIIRGSAVGHNGFSSGLTAPNPKSQEAVIRQALQRAEVTAEEVGYLEAHGTGTELGDPIEVTAASAAYCKNRTSDNPLLIGSVKTNIGHLEAAAGMAGLIKVLLAMQNHAIPGQMNFETPNPHIPWDDIPVQVLTKPTAWPNPDRRIAGISAFGMSGTNAHVVVEAPGNRTPSQASIKPDSKSESGRSEIITLSTKNPEAIFELADAYIKSLSADDAPELATFAFATQVSRSHFEHRAAVVASDKSDAIENLRSLSRGATSDSVSMGNRRRAPRVAWQFTGQGAQYVGMGRQLYETETVFRDCIDQCDEQLKSIRDGSLLDVLFHDESEQPAINNTHWTQPATFALQMGLAKLLNSWGIFPDAVLGHSVGQYAAACVAGILSWEDGLKLIAERGRMIGDLPSGGQMLAVFAPVDAVRSAIESEPTVSLAALNGTHIVISGDVETIDRIDQAFSDKSVRTKKLTTSHAFHSHFMDPILKPFSKFADTIQFNSPKLPLVCNVSGEVLPSDAKLDGDYWAKHIREAVSFAPSIDALSGLNCELLVELGPQSVLTRMSATNWKHEPDSLISCLQKTRDDNESLGRAIGRMYSQGLTPDFRGMKQETNSPNISLPTYPFQRRRFWGPDKPRAAHSDYHTAHPLLGGQISLAGSENESRYEGFIDTDSPSWMPDHEVMNATVVPGAALVEMAIQASGSRSITDVVFEQPIRPTERTALQAVINHKIEEDSYRSKLQIFASPASSKNWQRHFTCFFESGPDERPAKLDLGGIKASLPETDSADHFYQKMNSMGLNYGPAFRCIRELYFSDEKVLTRLESSGDIRGYNIPPTLLDAALHSLAVGLVKSDDDDILFLPIGMGKIDCYSPIESAAWCFANWKQKEGPTRTADLTLFSDDGEALLKIEDLKIQQISLAAMRQMSGAGAERLVYELTWKQTRFAPSNLDPKHWLVISNAESCENSQVFAERFAAALIDEGHTVHAVRLASGTDYSVTEDQCQISGDTSEHWEQVLENFSGQSSQPTIDGVAWIFPGATETTNSVLDTNVESIMKFTQAMIARNWRRLPCGMQLITFNAIDSGDQTASINPSQTQLWGLGRVLGAEQPELRCRLLDLISDEIEDESTANLAAEIARTETNDSQHLIRSGQVYVARMAQSKLKKHTYAANSEGCYLVTGGLGKLGRQVAKWFAERGAQQLVLVSRRQPDEEAQSFIDTIEQTGCQVVVHSADISVRSDVEKLFERFGHDLNPLSGVVHAAGVLDDALVESQTPERFEKVLKPKVAAATLLDELTREQDLDLFVLYSSAASVLGSPGQSNYATGNAFLDGLAYKRRQLGLPALSINWGPWTEGMADDERILKRLALQGITPLSVNEAHAAMEKMLGSENVQATVMDVDWRRMRIGPNGDVPAMLQDLVGSRKKTRGADSALVIKLKQMRGPAQRELLLKTIQHSLQRILSTPDKPETDRPLIEMGLDSLMAVEFGTELQQMLGDQFNVGPTMLFDHPTIDAITDHVLELVTASDGESEPDNATAKQSSESGDQPKSVTREDIAIVGMSCRFPGAENVNEFWQNLLNGVDSVCDIPDDRWDIDRFYSADREPGKMYTRRGGFLSGIADFDAEFFNISEKEACWIDPQHRMLLENSYRAFEDAGIPTSPLADSNVGVFMGIMGSDYAFLPTLDDEDIIKGFQGAGLSHSAGVGRISYLFGFEGPSVAVDTASSSSLVAVFQAMRSLQDGNCNLALAGGVNAILAPVNSLLMSKTGLLSPDGRCKSFSSAADGFGRGEGCGVVVLKRLSDAKRDGDRIMAVIRGGAVVHNGFSGGITSPSGKAQSRVIDAAVKDAGIAPSQVQYLEAHGTGTEYGDPMELGAAVKIYGKGRAKDKPLLVGSVKPNISHLEAAGGSSGLIKTVLALHHGVIPPQIHFDEPSPHIPWKRMPVQMVSETTDWPECDRRTAGVTAIGLVGTNAHLVLSAPEVSDAGTTETDKSGEPKEHLLVTSSRSDRAFLELLQQYQTYLQSNPQTNLSDFCFTVATGRRHFENRLALTFQSQPDAIETLGKAIEDLRLSHSSNGHASSAEKESSNTGLTKSVWYFGKTTVDHRAAIAELMQAQPAVQDFINSCAERLDEHVSDSGQSASLLQALEDEAVEFGSAELFEFLHQASLVKLFGEWGIQPDATAGLGVGQYTAACIAGCLCFFDATILVYERHKLTATEPESEDLDAFESLADQFNFYPPNLPLVCSISGEVIAVHRSLGGSYWKDHVTAEAKIVETIEAVKTLGCRIGMLFETESADALKGDVEELALISLLPDAPSERAYLLKVIGRLYELGCDPDFAAVLGTENRRKLSLPNYPFQKKRYWITEISQFMDKEDKPEVKSALT